jgi:hypothetical protein
MDNRDKAQLSPTWACAYMDCNHRADGEVEEQYDRYGIYAGRWHEKCWDKHGYGDFVFDASYAGESLEEDY